MLDKFVYYTLKGGKSHTKCAILDMSTRKDFDAIHMTCNSTCKRKDGTYMNYLTPFTIPTVEWEKDDLIQIVTASPMVPGKLYQLRVVGIFPGFASNHECSSDMLSFYSEEILHGEHPVDVYEEQERLRNSAREAGA